MTNKLLVQDLEDVRREVHRISDDLFQARSMNRETREGLARRLNSAMVRVRTVQIKLEQRS